MSTSFTLKDAIYSIDFKLKKEDLLKKLNSEKNSYKKKLAQNLAQQDNIRDMLDNLRFGYSSSENRVKVVKKEIKDDLDLYEIKLWETPDSHVSYKG